MNTTQRSGERVLSDLEMLLNDMSRLLDDLQQGSSGAVLRARKPYDDTLRQARARITDWRHRAAKQVCDAGTGLQAYVLQHPWRAVGIAAATGVALAALMTAGSRD